MIPIGNRIVINGMSERTQSQMIEQMAHSLFTGQAADRIIVARMSRDRAHMHFDTVLTMLDVDKVTVFPEVVKSMVIYTLRPGREEAIFRVTREENFMSAVTDSLKIGDPDVIPTGGGTYEASREQWDDGIVNRLSPVS